MPGKAVVLGLDGVPHSLLLELIKQGVMPNLANIISRGSFVPMETTFPEVSSVSWTSFMTGKNPGEHGIYGFMELKPGSYQMYFPNSGEIKAPTIWETIGARGKRSIILNLPQTYPTRPLNGILTSGFVALDLQKATYPESACQYLKSIDYKIDVDAEKAQTSLELLSEDIKLTFEKRRQAFLHFLDNKPWDLFMAVITETDRLHHFMWHAWENENDPLHLFFIDMYKKIDELIGEIYERKGDEAVFYVLSDHGFTGIKQEVYLTNFLKQEGFLNFSKETPDSMADITPDSKALVLDPSRIYIHLKGKYPGGSVLPTEHDKTCHRIKGSLLAMKYNGEKVIRQVLHKEEIYSGQYLDLAPDLIAWGEKGFDLKASIKKEGLFGRTKFSGMHTRDDAFFLADREIDLAERFNIVDVAPIILETCG